MEETLEADLDFFANYGDPDNDLDEEIRNDLQSFIINSLRSLPFDRNRGLGLESLENETMDPAREIILKTYIVEQIFARYNAQANALKQIATSVEFIDIKHESEAVLISIRYFNVKDVGTAEMEMEETTVTLP